MFLEELLNRIGSIAWAGLVFVVGLLLIAIILKQRKRKKYDLSRITITDIDQMTGHEFEDYLYVLFSAIGYETALTKKSRDFGADLLFYDRDDVKTVVQAKRLAEKLGLDAVQEIYTASAYYDAKRALIVTSTDQISDPCRKLASATKVRIIDRTDLKEVIKAMKRGYFEEAQEIIEEAFEEVSYSANASLEHIAKTKGMIRAGDYFYKG